MPVRRVWLRISYGEGGEGGEFNPLESMDAYAIGEITGQDDSRLLVLDDATRYKHADWSQVLYCLPEIVDSLHGGPKSPDRRRASIREAKEEVEPELENEEDEEARAEIRECIQQVWATGFLWVQDAETAETGEVLLVWLDEFGRVVRENRVDCKDPEELHCKSGMLGDGRDSDLEWWSTAFVGETYEGGAWPS